MLKPGARFVGGRGEAIYRAWSMGGCSGRDRDPTGPTAESNVRRGAVARIHLGSALSPMIRIKPVAHMNPPLNCWEWFT